MDPAIQYPTKKFIFILSKFYLSRIIIKRSWEVERQNINKIKKIKKMKKAILKILTSKKARNISKISAVVLTAAAAGGPWDSL